jgi:cob(I)alamin adenosyltransferase
MAPFYTAAGDTGETSYLGAGGISKSSLRIEAVGSVDEANAAIGLARALSESEQTRAILFTVQQHLYLLMTELSASPDVADKFDKLDNGQLNWLEAKIDDLEAAVEMPKVFIIPGSSPASGALDLARTIIRRAERRTVALLEEKQILKQLLVAYLNRLSSLLFVLEVYESSNFGHQIQLTKEA